MLKKLLTVNRERILPLLLIILLLVIAIPQFIPEAIQTNTLRTVSAAGVTDYTLTGTNDNVIFQSALDDLPATGGTLQVVSSGTIDWANGVTVTRAIDNVVIQGAGTGTFFDGDDVTAIFTAGGDYWSFRDFSTDAGGLATGVTTGWSMTNILIDTDYYAYRGTIFDGDVADFVYLNTQDVAPQADSTYDIGAIGNEYANIYADAFHGDGSGLTGIGSAGELDLNMGLADHSASGVVIELTAGANLTFGQICYVDVNGEMQLADADADTTVPALFMCIEVAGIEEDASGDFLVSGIVRDDTWTWVLAAGVGNILYVSNTPGAFVQVANIPVGSGDQIQIVGHCLTAHIVYFNPSPVIIELN